MDAREGAINRMLTIIDRISQKLKLAICVPALIKEDKYRKTIEAIILKEVPNSTSCKDEYLLMIKKEWLTEESPGVVRASSVECRKLKSSLSVTLSLLMKYKEKIMPMIEAMLEERADDVPTVYGTIVEHVEYLKDNVQWKMGMTAKQSRARDDDLRNAKALITITHESIQKLESDFVDETLNYNVRLNESRREIIHLNLAIEGIKNERAVELGRETNSYKTRLRRLREDVAERENNLNEQLGAREAVLETLIQADVEEERLLREYCDKAERKYLEALDAYDRDLCKLHELRETLDTQLSVTSSHCDTLKSESDVQSVVFVKLKEERELAIMQAFAERMERLEKNRAARTIQRAWRAHLARKSLRRRRKRTRRKK